MDYNITQKDNIIMKTKYNNFKLHENVEFLQRDVRNWRFGKIVQIIDAETNTCRYKIYSGTDMFWARQVINGQKVQLETL
jgi:hypothetical protein